MKKTILALFLIGLFFALPFITQASKEFPEGAQTIINRAESVVYTVFLTLVVIMFIISGVLFATSAGDPNQMEKAKKALIYALIGTFIGVIAATMKDVLVSWFGS